MIWLFALLGTADAGRADVGGYFRVAARPDLQGGNGRLGYWNLYGRLMNEGSYGMVELRYDILEPQPSSGQPWTALHARIEGGSIANADGGNGSLANFRLSQVYVKGGNIGLRNVTWQMGTLEYFFGDMGLYDMRPATIFFDTVGLSARYETKHLEVQLGVGDSGFRRYGTQYNAILTPGGTARLRLGKHLELGVGGELFIEGGTPGNVNAPYQTEGVAYEDWVRGEVMERYNEAYPGLEDYFPGPSRRQALSYNAIGYVGFGGFGPILWNNTFLSFKKQHPEKYSTETLAGREERIYLHDFTDERYALVVGNEMQLKVVPGRFDIAWGALYGSHWDQDNSIVPTDHDRWYGSVVLRTQTYVTDTVHILVESSLAREYSRNGNAYREHADSLFANEDGVADVRGLEYGDTDTRNTWQGKGGVVLNPLGPGVFMRPSLRILYGLQYSNQNNAFGNSFVESVDQYNDFENVEQHWHHLGALEAEVWF